MFNTIYFILFYLFFIYFLFIYYLFFIYLFFIYFLFIYRVLAISVPINRNTASGRHSAISLGSKNKVQPKRRDAHSNSKAFLIILSGTSADRMSASETLLGSIACNN